MDRSIGVLGGGQLGRMLTEAANRLNVKVVTLDTENSPAKQVNGDIVHVTGSCKDPHSIRLLAKKCDIITIEIEHVDTEVLEELDARMHMKKAVEYSNDADALEIQPSWRTIRIIQDKYIQKQHLKTRGIATAHSIPIPQNNAYMLASAAEELHYPFMLKSRTNAYDGRGNCPVHGPSELEAAVETLKDRPVYAEQWADFRLELAVMVVKTENKADVDWHDSTMAFPVVETLHQDSICKLVYAPARNILATTADKAQNLARQAVATFEGKGIFGVEMFVLQNGELLLNEIAPRPHNSGHYTMDACSLSQFDAHLRAILALPIPKMGLNLLNGETFAIMINILGGICPESHIRVAQRALSIPGAKVHLYGKGSGRPGRKMGHVTVLATSMEEAEARVSPLVQMFDDIRYECRTRDISESTEMSSTGQRHRPMSKSRGEPLVAVTMGSDSDRSVLAAGIHLLEELEIPYSVSITSAHRTPSKMIHFATEAASRGNKVIIAAAGGAAHLPGMIAANTSLPVIGVPVKASHLEGLDSLLSIVQMPRGCPVATVAINNSLNAAQLAIRILGIHDPAIRARLDQHLADQTRSVEEKATKMEMGGFHAYCNND